MTGILPLRRTIPHYALLLALAARLLLQTQSAAQAAMTAGMQGQAKPSSERSATCQIDSQSPQVHLSGTVSDPLGGLVSGATVTLKCGRFRQETRSISDGTYSTSVPAGTYQVEVTAPDFELLRQSINMQAGGNREQTLNFSLEIKRATSIVTVTAPPGYVATSTTTATKTATPLIETPQSVSVITLDQMRSRSVQSLGEIIRYSAGVGVDRFGADSRFDWFSIRGFDESSFGLFRDNSRWQSGTVEGQIDPYLLQEVDVIRGPSSVLYGQNTPGGLVNLVTKRPQAEPSGEFILNFGSYARKQFQGDIGGPLDRNARWRYRLTGLYRDSNTQVKFVPDDRRFIAPALTWATQKTTLTILTDYQYDNLGWAQFLPSQGTFAANPNGKIATDFFTGEPGFDYFHRQQWSVGYLFEHRFSKVWTLRQTSRYSRIAFDGKTVFGGGLQSDLRSLTRFGFSNNLALGLYTLDSQALAQFKTKSVQHSLLFGADYSHLDTKINSGFSSAPPLDVFHPVYGQAVPALFVFTRTDEPSWQTGLYIQDHIKFAEKIIMTLSGREDWTKLTTRNLLANSVSEQSPSRFTGRAGITYVSDFGLAPYFSYSTSFLPTPGVNFFAVPFRPTTGAQYEGGVKFQPRRSASFITASLFQITQQNVQTPDPANPLNTLQTGEIRARGVELEGVASILNGLNLHVAYSNLDQVVTKTTDPTQAGKRPTLVPKQLFSISADYTISKGALLGLGGNIGVRSVGTTAGDPQNTFILPAYTLLDASLRYDYKRIGLQINATNLGDKIYVPVCQSASFCNYGYRRDILGSISYRWDSLRGIFK